MNRRPDDTRKPVGDNCLVRSEVAAEPLSVRSSNFRLLGRLLLPEDDKPGKADVAILSDRVWKRFFNGDPTIVGKTIVVNGNPFVVAGVMQPGFRLDAEVMPSDAAGPEYREDKPVISFYRKIESRVAHLPGVVAEGIVSGLPLTGSVGWGGIHVEGYTPPPGQELQADIRITSRDYFRTMEIPLRGPLFQRG